MVGFILYLRLQYVFGFVWSSLSDLHLLPLGVKYSKHQNKCCFLYKWENFGDGFTRQRVN